MDGWTQRYAQLLVRVERRHHVSSVVGSGRSSRIDVMQESFHLLLCAKRQIKRQSGGDNTRTRRGEHCLRRIVERQEGARLRSTPGQVLGLGTKRGWDGLSD